MTSEWRYNVARAQNSRSSVKYSPKLEKNENFAKKSSKYRNFTSPVFWIILAFLIYTVRFKTIQSTNFSKWWLLIFSGGNHPPYPPSLTAYLTPLPRTPDLFFHKNDRKGCTLGLTWLRSLSFRFWGDREKNLEGWYYPPLGGWGLLLNPHPPLPLGGWGLSSNPEPYMLLN